MHGRVGRFRGHPERLGRQGWTTATLAALSEDELKAALADGACACGGEVRARSRRR